MSMKVYSRRQLMMEEGRTYIQKGLVFHLDGINKGNDSTAWTDLKGGIKFAYNAHSSVQVNGIKMDGSGTINSNRANTTRWDTGTIEIVVSERSGGGVIFMGTNLNYFSIQMSNYQIGWHPKTNNTYNIPIPSKMTVSINNVRAILNGNAITTKIQNNWEPNRSFMTIGGRGNANYWYSKIKVHAIRIYSRQLSESEILYNQRLDNRRFGLGLNI